MQFASVKDWPKKRMYDAYDVEASEIDPRLQNYLLNPNRLGPENRDGSSGYQTVIEKLFLGDVTNATEDNIKMTLGYFWSDKKADSAGHVIERKRYYPFMLGKFPDMDPYKQLYELADSEEQSDFWMNLEDCVQKKTKERQKYKIKDVLIKFHVFQPFEYPIFTQVPIGHNKSCLDEVGTTYNIKSCKRLSLPE